MEAQLLPRVSRQSGGSEPAQPVRLVKKERKKDQKMATASVRSLAVLVIWQTVTVGSGFEFDHAFRKISMENSPELRSMDTLMKRIGLAMGEEEEVEEPLEEHKLLRRVGLGPEDQDAVESMLNPEVSR